MAGTDVPCAEYATYGTVRLAKNAFKSNGGYKSSILSNHGMLAGGANLSEAYNIAENVEILL